MKSFACLFTLIVALGWTVTACTTTHTEAELRSQELQRNAHDRVEEARDTEIGEEGGIGQDELDGQEDEAIRESEL